METTFTLGAGRRGSLQKEYDATVAVEKPPYVAAIY
jgi:hypothetical protein